MFAAVAFESTIDGVGDVIIVMMVQELSHVDRRTVSPVIFRDVNKSKKVTKFRAVVGGSGRPIFANLALFLKENSPGSLLPGE